jgi:glycerol-3-phosphate dehydrogenase (NAD(P)+)
LATSCSRARTTSRETAGSVSRSREARAPPTRKPESGQVVEGVLAARAVHRVARRSGVEMPISEQIYRVLYEGVTPKGRRAVADAADRQVRTGLTAPA